MPIVGAAYLRCSDPKQDKSIDQQRVEIERRAAADGVVIPPENWFIDEGISGRSTKRRTSYQGLIKRAEAQRDALRGKGKARLMTRLGVGCELHRADVSAALTGVHWPFLVGGRCRSPRSTPRCSMCARSTALSAASGGSPVARCQRRTTRARCFAAPVRAYSTRATWSPTKGSPSAPQGTGRPSPLNRSPIFRASHQGTGHGTAYCGSWSSTSKSNSRPGPEVTAGGSG